MRRAIYSTVGKPFFAWHFSLSHAGGIAGWIDNHSIDAALTTA
jgi:hypothetical protein